MVAFLSVVTFPVSEWDFLASKSDRKSAPKMSARLQILQMESFALFLPTLPSSWAEGRCSGSENRRKCDGVLASCWQFATFEGQLGRNPHCWLGAKISLNVEWVTILKQLLLPFCREDSELFDFKIYKMTENWSERSRGCTLIFIHF